VLLQSQEGRKFFFQSSWLSEDRPVSALKEQLGVSELPVQMIHTVEEQAALVAQIPRPEPVTIQVKLSRKAITVIIGVNLVANFAALPIFLHFV
jgi:hypothetical protein